MFTVHSRRSRQEGHPSSKRSRILARVLGAGVATTVAVTGLAVGVAQVASASVAATYTTVTDINHYADVAALRVQLSATVQATAGTPTVDQGTVTFSVAGQLAKAEVSNGTAKTVVELPPGLPDGTYAISAIYHDWLRESFGFSAGHGILFVRWR